MKCPKCGSELHYSPHDAMWFCVTDGCDYMEGDGSVGLEGV